MYAKRMEDEKCCELVNFSDAYKGCQASRLGQSLITTINRCVSQIDLKYGWKHRLVIINKHTKFHQNQSRSCKLLIDLTWNAPDAM